MDNLTEEEWLFFPEPFRNFIQQERNSSTLPPDMNTIDSAVRSIQYDHPEALPISTRDVSQAYVQAPVVSEDDDDLITIAEFPSDDKNSSDSDASHDTWASIAFPNNHNIEEQNGDQDSDEDSEIQQRAAFFHQIWGPPQEL